jgi:isopropylmalate/homocitrate/citramalate synthase
MQEEGFIDDWNSPDICVSRLVSFCNETLRDGLQSLSVPTIHTEERLGIHLLMKSLGIDSANTGLSAASAQVVSDGSKPASKSVAQNLVSDPIAPPGRS